MKLLRYAGVLLIGALAGSILISDAFIFLSDIRHGVALSNLLDWYILFYSMMISKSLLLLGIILGIPIFLGLMGISSSRYWLTLTVGTLFAVVPLALMAFEFSTRSQLTHAKSERFFITSLSLGGADATFAYIAWRFLNRTTKPVKAADVFT